MLDECPVGPTGLARFVEQLNLGTKQSLDAEWELIILSALSRVGTNAYELDQGGSKLDFRFQDGTGLFVAGDISTVSDDEADRKNPHHHFSSELSRRASQRRITTGQFVIGIVSDSGGEKPNEVRLRLPEPHRFKQVVFHSEFERFLDRIVSCPDGVHEYCLNNNEAALTITYRPAGGRTHLMHFADYSSPKDLVRNILHNRLERKADQIRKAGLPSDTGFSGIIICDAGSSALRQRTGVNTFGFEQIARYFLRKSKTVDFVAAITIARSEPDYRVSSAPRYAYEVRIAETSDLGVDGTFGALLREGLAQIPLPIRTPANAKAYLEWSRDQGLSTLKYGDNQGVTLGNTFTVSSRAVFDYLAGRIGREKFEDMTDAWSLSILKRDLDAGGTVNSVEFRRIENRDDDELKIGWRDRDVAASQFTNPLASTASRPEN